MADKPVESTAEWLTPVGLQPLNSITPQTPVFPLLKARLEFSDGSSKQDSGYRSFTPGSIDSLMDRCRYCNSIKKDNYDHSTPHSSLMCYCKKSTSENPSPCHLEMISESNVYSSRPCSSRNGIGQQLNLYDDALDSSLYNDPMDVEEEGSSEDFNCLLGFDERSMDFAEAHFEPTPEPQGNQDDKKGILVNSLESTNIKKIKHVKFPCKGVASLSGRSTVFNEETTPTKKKKPSRFPSTAKKIATLVKVVKCFSLCGIEKLDFLYQFCVKMNCQPIGSQILSYLSDKDLHNARQVSSTWTEIVDNDCKSYKRWRIYYNNLNMWKENYISPVKRQHSSEEKEFDDSPRCLRRLDMNVCTPHQNSARYPHSPPISPNSARFRSFQKAAKQLKAGERLLRCPKCFFASQDKGNPVVQCTRSGCRHRFCFWCCGEIIPGSDHHCRPLYSPRNCNSPNKSYTAGSKKSKRLLRRLSSFER